MTVSLTLTLTLKLTLKLTSSSYHADLLAKEILFAWRRCHQVRAEPQVKAEPQVVEKRLRVRVRVRVRARVRVTGRERGVPYGHNPPYILHTPYRGDGKRMWCTVWCINSQWRTPAQVEEETKAQDRWPIGETG